MFLSGQGEFQVNGETFPVGEGSVVRVSASAASAWRNVGLDDLHYFCIQAPENGCVSHGIDDGEGVESPLVWP